MEIGPKAYHIRVNGEKQSELGKGGYMTHDELLQNLLRMTKGLRRGDALTIHCEALDRGSGTEARRDR